MTARFWIRLAEIAFLFFLAITIFIAWREDRRDRAQLTTALAEARQVLNAADARQHDRDAQLNQTLASIATQKRAAQTQTPAQLLSDLSHTIPLPAPLSLQATAIGSSQQPKDNKIAAMEYGHGATIASPSNQPGKTSKTPLENPAAQTTPVVIPSEDLRPLYDFALDCKACQAKLAASQGDLADEKVKTTALTKERDAALKAARGGSLLKRVARAVKWFALGAAAGAIASKAMH